MTTLRVSLGTLVGAALTLGVASGAGANDFSVPQDRMLIQEARTSWAPGYVQGDGQYVRTVPAPESSGMVSRLALEGSRTWKPGYTYDGGKYVRRTVSQSSIPGANVAHFDRHPSSGSFRDDDGTWVHFD